MLLTAIATLDEVLHTHVRALGNDFTAYRNHTYRVANLCVAFAGRDPEQIEKIAIATAFHDLGIWTDGTIDYLPPSIRLASAYLASTNRTAWTSEIATMILEHHKIRPYRGEPHGLVESFRRADLVDLSFGLVTFGLPRTLLRELASAWPNAGFHQRLIQLSLARLRTHPLNPLPMMRF